MPMTMSWSDYLARFPPSTEGAGVAFSMPTQIDNATGDFRLMAVSFDGTNPVRVMPDGTVEVDLQFVSSFERPNFPSTTDGYSRATLTP